MDRRPTPQTPWLRALERKGLELGLPTMTFLSTLHFVVAKICRSSTPEERRTRDVVNVQGDDHLVWLEVSNQRCRVLRRTRTARLLLHPPGTN